METEQIFCNRIVETLAEKKPKSKSLIKQWLGEEDIPHAHLVKFGTKFENALNDLIALARNTVPVTTAISKTYMTPVGQLTPISVNNKDIDLLYIVGDTVYYREVKCNLNLDSEKGPETARKMEKIGHQLESLYPGYEVDVAILNMKWGNHLAEKWGMRIEYMEEFLSRIRLPTPITEERWANIGRRVGEEIINATNS